VLRRRGLAEQVLPGQCCKRPYYSSVARGIPGVRRIVAVASGKGGVGKTTVTVNLALALVASGARVGIFDADVYGPNVPLMLGVRREKGSTASIPVARAGREPYITALERFGLKVMSFGLLVGDTDTVLPDSHFAGMMVEQTMRDVMWGELDYLLLDLPPGSGEPQQGLVKQLVVDGAVIVTTPQDLSLMDTGRSLGLYRKAGVLVLGVVENMSYLTCPHCGERVDVLHRTENAARPWIVEDASLELLGRIPMTLDVSQPIHAAHPLVVGAEEQTSAETFRQIARRVREKLG
jgi:ATP-binding protein involved in chromosome partitioning